MHLAGVEKDVKIFGFWIYLMTDLVIFAVLFAAFVVLRPNTFGGPSSQELSQFSVPFAETMVLLTSSFTCSLATFCVYRKKKYWVMFWFIVTFLLGISFLCLELTEFTKLIEEGAGPKRSAFLSAFFTLVGTHGLHISIGLLWMAVEIFRLGFRGLLIENISKLFRLALFWHFLDVVWIFIFTIVYAMGHLL